MGKTHLCPFFDWVPLFNVFCFCFLVIIIVIIINAITINIFIINYFKCCFDTIASQVFHFRPEADERLCACLYRCYVLG